MNSRVRVKVLKFLFRNADSVFNIEEMSNRIQEPLSVVRKEVKRLVEIGLLKQKQVTNGKRQISKKNLNRSLI